MLVVLVGFGVMSLIHADLETVAEALVAHLHLSPDGHYSRIFLELVTNLSSSRLWMVAGVAFLYASLRFIEAYGLWRQRAWAEWFAVLSGAIYIPFELYELMKGVSSLKLITLAINLIIVAYIGRVLIERHQIRRLAD